MITERRTFLKQQANCPGESTSGGSQKLRNDLEQLDQALIFRQGFQRRREQDRREWPDTENTFRDQTHSLFQVLNATSGGRSLKGMWGEQLVTVRDVGDRRDRRSQNLWCP